MDTATALAGLALLAVGAAFLYLRAYIPEVAKGTITRELTEHGERFRSVIRGEELVRQARWEIKREACLQALAIVDAYWSNVPWYDTQADGSKKLLNIQRQPKPDIAAVRACLNRLMLSCDDVQVAETYKRCIGGSGVVDGGDIDELRSLIRQELGFGPLANVNRRSAFIGRLEGVTETIEASPPSSGQSTLTSDERDG